MNTFPNFKGQAVLLVQFVSYIFKGQVLLDVWKRSDMLPETSGNNYQPMPLKITKEQRRRIYNDLILKPDAELSLIILPILQESPINWIRY